jgi:hypothetical protein
MTAVSVAYCHIVNHPYSMGLKDTYPLPLVPAGVEFRHSSPRAMALGVL